jgi:hypothetical protein
MAGNSVGKRWRALLGVTLKSVGIGLLGVIEQALAVLLGVIRQSAFLNMYVRCQQDIMLGFARSRPTMRFTPSRGCQRMPTSRNKRRQRFPTTLFNWFGLFVPVEDDHRLSPWPNWLGRLRRVALTANDLRNTGAANLELVSQTCLKLAGTSTANDGVNIRPRKRLHGNIPWSKMTVVYRRQKWLLPTP